MMRILKRILVNALALYIAVLVVPGFQIHGGLWEYLLAGLILGLLNLTLRPLLRLLTFPLILLTFGLFSIVINAVILWVVYHEFTRFMSVSGTLALVLATLVISAVNTLLTHNE